MTVSAPRSTGEVDIIRAHGGEDGRAFRLGELDREMADAAGAAVDQHGLARNETAMIEQPLPGGHRRKRNRGRVDQVDRFRRGDKLAGLDDDKFALGAAIEADMREHRVALRQRGRAGAGRLDGAGEIAARG